MGSSVDTEANGLATAPVEGHFRTDHLLPNIGRRAVSGGFVTIAMQAGKFLINFLAAGVLARLLSPKDFGLVGMVLGFTGLVGVFNAMGLSTATIQRDTITQKQVSNLFWINVGSSGLMAITSFAVAPWAARFYHDPRIVGIMQVLALTFLLTGLTVQHQALLTRQMRFQALAVIDVGSSTIGFAVACVMAWFGAGYWALVAQQLVTIGSTLTLTWMTSGWRPHLPSRNSGVKPLVRFGAHLSLADFLALLTVNSDNILIGRFFGAESLGLYTRANVLLSRPLQQVMMPVNSILIPVLSRLQGDPQRYRRSHMRAYDTLALIVFSFSAICFVLAKPLVLVILGSKWTAVIPLFAAFSLVAVSGPLSAIGPWIYESQGRGHDQLRNHTAAGVVTLLSYLIGLHWGPLGLILSLAITSFLIRMPIIYYIAGRRGPVTTRDLWMGFLCNLPCWGAVFLATSLAYRVVEAARLSPFMELLVCGPIGLCGGGLLILMFPRPREGVFHAWNMVKDQLTERFAIS